MAGHFGTRQNRTPVCKQCGTGPKYRSGLCRQHYFDSVRSRYRLKPMRSLNCMQCGAEFTSRTASKKFCSPRCRERFRWGKWRASNRTTTCPQCGSEFQKPHILAKFCSKRCKDKARQLRRNKTRIRVAPSAICCHCQKHFTPARHRYSYKRIPKFCSRACAYAARTLRVIPGRFSKWESKAKKIRAVDKVCLCCGGSNRLAADHVIPFRLMEQWGFNPNMECNLLSACGSCHGKKTRAEKSLLAGDIVEFCRRMREINYPAERLRAMFELVGLPVSAII